MGGSRNRNEDVPSVYSHPVWVAVLLILVRFGTELSAASTLDRAATTRVHVKLTVDERHFILSFSDWDQS